jgi:hypothetical protein
MPGTTRKTRTAPSRGARFRREPAPQSRMEKLRDALPSRKKADARPGIRGKLSSLLGR